MTKKLKHARSNGNPHIKAGVTVDDEGRLVAAGGVGKARYFRATHKK